MNRPELEDICKLLSIKQGQGKKDKATSVAIDCMRTGKLHSYRFQKRKTTGQEAVILETKH